MPAELRTLTVKTETRVYTAVAQLRVLALKAESRTYTVPKTRGVAPS